MVPNPSDLDVEVSVSSPMSPIEPDDQLVKFDVSVKWIMDDEEDERTATVATARLILLDPFLCEESSLLDACDAYSQELLDAYAVLFDRDGNLSRPPLDQVVHGVVWYLEHLIVEPQYRGYGIGTALLNWMMRFLCRNQGALVLLPVPLEIEKSNDSLSTIRVVESGGGPLTARLRRFFERLHFFPLWGTSYMYWVLEWKPGVRAL